PESPVIGEDVLEQRLSFELEMNPVKRIPRDRVEAFLIPNISDCRLRRTSRGNDSLALAHFFNHTGATRHFEHEYPLSSRERPMSGAKIAQELLTLFENVERKIARHDQIRFWRGRGHYILLE